MEMIKTTLLMLVTNSISECKPPKFDKTQSGNFLELPKTLNCQEITTINSAIWGILLLMLIQTNCEIDCNDPVIYKSVPVYRLRKKQKTITSYIHNPSCWKENHYLYFNINLSYLPNPSPRAEYDTRSIFKRSLTGLNSEFFLLLDYLPHQGWRTQSVLLFTHS